ncbi:MAG TPA: enoyl-CoA hydratase-related protein [Arachidicoccus soli]|uniref:Enoyl-CoA hydratase/isomerase family protein n=1 Tax=Arachidicoccus soli TaxID=2341117 RepID=A0A386HRG4_9BACT|nr:enoyl-CoA hydratase/isomerase family protein [Arachidicoccus soli]AYD48548.1 enoyl-CoA hydratase/isomerase family protein [Arachidicoccus soli]HEU0227969.1 enoyl-CoA hydratase-related protein [Arachidicoccus soli]
MIVDEAEAKEGYVKAEVHNQITTIEFYHPKGNALPSRLLAKLTQEIDHASHDDSTNVILLRSVQHEVFCSGAYFNELMEIKNETEATRFFMGFANVINAMRKCSKLIVARIHGKSVGGGVGLAAAADYAIALEGADVRLSELSIGIGPYVIAPALIRKMGLSASQIAIDAHLWRNSDWARRKGLYAELHPNKESMEESIERLLGSLSKNSNAANSALKRMLWEGCENWDQLLAQRAATTGKLLMQEQTQSFLGGFNKTVVF